ncbi:hypothetical protein BPLS_P4024 [Bathymodiolus platifrons methanotrophic gill symbiont]|uniref:hypothetical protein n=1 Tax=Bathymodiolus platifrons methanotrophic gill symbiont TaxID=113268 RepID=UPI001B75E209|nr:hypothetical protein [Bathymodiolus platifrons methanotrophic gill symbiont]GFO76319.1 hypothetical protein BPLS_P4024 [Bathymodiolus platifrons methanotrophic gill symbiont]
MSDLFEVVFENIVKNNVIQLLMLLISKAGRIINVQCSEDIRLIVEGSLDAKALDSVLNFNGSVTVFINVTDMTFGSIILPNVLLRLVKYDEKYDIDFNFDSNEMKNTDMMNLVTDLHYHAKEIAKGHDVGALFGGLEPASDEDTRYFTNNDLGVLSQEV